MRLPSAHIGVANLYHNKYEHVAVPTPNLSLANIHGRHQEPVHRSTTDAPTDCRYVIVIDSALQGTQSHLM